MIGLRRPNKLSRVGIEVINRGTSSRVTPGSSSQHPSKPASSPGRLLGSRFLTTCLVSSESRRTEMPEDMRTAADGRPKTVRIDHLSANATCRDLEETCASIA